MSENDLNEEYLQNIEDLMDDNRLKSGGTVSNSNSNIKDGEYYDDEPDETLGERLWGLTEMFPEPLRDFTGAAVNITLKSVKCLYKFSCSASWIFFTSSVILFAPVVFETERAQMKEIQKIQQKQVLLGPGSVMSTVGPQSDDAAMLR